MANKNQILKHILSLLLSFLLALAAIVTLAVFAINTTVSQPQYMKNKIVSSDYAKKASKELEERFTSYGAASGFEIEAFAPLLNQETILNDMFLTIDKIYNLSDGPNYEKAQSLAFTALIDNVNNREIVITKEIQDGIDELAKTCAFDYVYKVTLPYFDYITSAIDKINSVANQFKTLLWIAIAILSVCILYLNKLSHRCFRYFSYACGTVFIVLAIVPSVILYSDKISYVSLSPLSLNHFFVSYVNGIFFVMLCMAFGALILSVLCMGCYYAFRSKKLKRSH